MPASPRSPAAASLTAPQLLACAALGLVIGVSLLGAGSSGVLLDPPLGMLALPPLALLLAGLLGLSSTGLGIALLRIRRQHLELADLHADQLRRHAARHADRFFDLPFVGISFTDPGSHRWLRVNDHLCRMLGRTREQLATLTWSELTHADDLEADLEQFRQLLAGEIDGYTINKRFLRADGTVLHARLDVRPQHDDGGRIEAIVATIDDISDDVRAREALEASEARWRRFVTEAPFPIMVHARDGRVVALSRAWTAMTGHDATDLHTIDDWIARACPPPLRPQVRARVAAIHAADGARVDERDHPVLCADGRRRLWMFSSVGVGVDDHGEPLAVTMAADVTELRELARRARDSAELYRRMFDSNPMAMFVWAGDDGRLLAVNDAAEACYGWPRDALLAMTVADLHPPTARPPLADASRRLAATAVMRPGLFPHRRCDGSTFTAQIAAHPMRYEGRPAWLTMVVDVTDLEQARAERDLYVRRLEQATEATLNVVSTIVELRDPYTAGHERRVGEVAAAIAAEMGMDAAFCHGLRMCAVVHDVGKIAIPAEILAKPTALTAPERRLVEEHAQLGYEILKSIELPWPLAEVARQHHERMDGSGYPRGLRGDAILPEARIIAVADVVESVGSHRPYRPALGVERALAMITAGRGSAFDPAVVDACLRLFGERGYVLPD